MDKLFLHDFWLIIFSHLLLINQEKKNSRYTYLSLGIQSFSTKNSFGNSNGAQEKRE